MNNYAQNWIRLGSLDPDLANGVVPDGLHVEDADGLPVIRAEDPIADTKAGL
jgi:hypothetical protein